jgi:pimeloyl-ACP methyl ester carboxylesterase
MRGLDLLAGLPFVRPGGFGAIGHSLGGHNSVYTAAFDERIRAVVSSCGLDSYADYKGGDLTGWTSIRYMPRLAAYKGRAHETPFDFDEILAVLAPRAVFLSAPLQDDNFRAASVDRIAAAAREVFALLGAPDNLAVEHPDCPHDFPDATREKAYAFLAKALKA